MYTRREKRFMKKSKRIFLKLKASFDLLSFSLGICIAGVIPGYIMSLTLLKNVEWGSVAEWLGAFGSIGAIGIVIWQVQRNKKDIEESISLDKKEKIEMSRPRLYLGLREIFNENEVIYRTSGYKHVKNVDALTRIIIDSGKNKQVDFIAGNSYPLLNIFYIKNIIEKRISNCIIQIKYQCDYGKEYGEYKECFSIPVLRADEAIILVPYPASLNIECQLVEARIFFHTVANEKGCATFKMDEKNKISNTPVIVYEKKENNNTLDNVVDKIIFPDTSEFVTNWTQVSTHKKHLISKN